MQVAQSRIKHSHVLGVEFVVAAIFIVYPHQLFEQPAIPSHCKKVVLWEHPLFFKQFLFHKQKLGYHFATMDRYLEMLNGKGYQVEKIPFDRFNNEKAFIDYWKQNGINQCYAYEPADEWIRKRLEKASQSVEMSIQWLESPMFLTPISEELKMLEPQKGYFMARFYQNQRKRTGILCDQAGKPLGGKWSFDAENRKKIPENTPLPLPILFQRSTQEIQKYEEIIHQKFSNHPGKWDISLYPLDAKEAKEVLRHFLRVKFTHFGIYEDAMVAESAFLWHSVLTPALNIGLITPQEILDETLSFGDSHQIPLNSLEGFIRQILGWREFMHLMYKYEGNTIRNQNYFGWTREIPASFWDGTTGILPVDTVIKRVLKTGYCHHIERLMVLGNFMLLCGFAPHSVYEWFMALFIDAYDWVMVPNVYSMSQYADGGLLTTKPYVSGSAYLLKMGNWKKGKWTEIWDALYWKFIWEHREAFAKNQRMSMMVALVNKMDVEKRNAHLKTAQDFLESLSHQSQYRT